MKAGNHTQQDFHTVKIIATKTGYFVTCMDNTQHAPMHSYDRPSHTFVAHSFVDVGIQIQQWLMHLSTVNREENGEQPKQAVR